ncbi:MAG: putative pre-16S rRNA nuclease [Alphaproteobacteria bacterium MarineAlpha5_Bin9]|nr:MAG: putative pre-16S rRNA nuclease [Alphaproteobacteria bacterium MarineAlpha5_Bin9]|tara:strand:- start:5579 stop:6037 length:459 start_codon:yes stop_codon:yes gene_type:complete
MILPKDFINEINISQNLFGLDFGDKTIGLAISDKSKKIALPLFTILRKSVEKDIKKLENLINEYDIGGIVMGLPLNLDGNENKNTKKIRDFASKMEKLLNIKITFYDERFSTDVIFKDLKKNAISKKKISKNIDNFAAAYILQGFLDNLNVD